MMFDVMKQLTYIFIVIFLNSCFQKSEQEVLEIENEIKIIRAEFEKDIITPEDSFFVFYNNCKISKDRVKEREKGNNIVFHYYYNSTNFASVADEEYFEQIQFEIPVSNFKDSIVIDNLKDVNFKFNWKCYCDWPDSLEENQNKGKLILLKKNESVWSVNLYVENVPKKKIKQINQDFVIYKPEYELIFEDTLNRFDEYRRKQGHWITEDYFKITNGVFDENYFTGSNSIYMYYRKKKILSSIYVIKNNNFIKKIAFDEFGNLKE